jgi:hypothetical protein
MSKDAKPLESEPVQALAKQFLIAIREHYRARPKTKAPDTVIEVLNALAGVTATIILAAKQMGEEAEAREFFSVALEGQLRQMEEDGYGREEIEQREGA